MRKWTYVNEEYGNIGTIEEVMTYPYKGAPKRQQGFRVTAMAAYEHNFVYHISVFETLQEAKDDLVRLCLDLENGLKEMKDEGFGESKNAGWS